MATFVDSGMTITPMGSEIRVDDWHLDSTGVTHKFTHYYPAGFDTTTLIADRQQAINDALAFAEFNDVIEG